MGNVWFTADQHFNHAKVLELMKRPFANLGEMHEALIENHNRVVKPGDRVYHLGDFAWFNPGAFISRLKGQHFLIKGNHDHRHTFKPEDGFIKVFDAKTIKLEGHIFHLSHYAHRVWPQSHYGAFHLYGHSHGMIADYGRSGDVGVDRWGFRPVNIDEVITRLGGMDITKHHPEPDEMYITVFGGTQ